MGGMFDNCYSLTSLDVSNFKTDNVANFQRMFNACSSLTTIYCNDTWTGNNSLWMFKGCNALRGAIGYDSGKTDVNFANPTTGYFTAVTMGDADGNGVVSVDDVKTVGSYIMGAMPSKFVFKGADANGDGKINVADIVTINNIIGGE